MFILYWFLFYDVIGLDVTSKVFLVSWILGPFSIPFKVSWGEVCIKHALCSFASLYTSSNVFCYIKTLSPILLLSIRLVTTTKKRFMLLLFNLFFPFIYRTNADVTDGRLTDRWCHDESLSRVTYIIRTPSWRRNNIISFRPTIVLVALLFPALPPWSLKLRWVTVRYGRIYSKPPKVPKAFEIPDLLIFTNRFIFVYKIIENLYRLNGYEKTWYYHLKNGLLNWGWRQLSIDECIFTKNGIIPDIYVDDDILISPIKKISMTK